MTDVTATEAARKFADLLDAVEHAGERYAVTRDGRAVAQIEPVAIVERGMRANGAAVKAFMRDHRPDPDWGRDLESVRQLLEIESRA